MPPPKRASASPRSALFRFAEAQSHDPAVDAWLARQPAELAALARPWFERMRACSRDVRELLHDGHPTACLEDAAFAYVNAFTAHVNVGFFHGAALPDPQRLLRGTGKSMRHVQLLPGQAIDEVALAELIEAACADMQHRLRAERTS